MIMSPSHGSSNRPSTSASTRSTNTSSNNNNPSSGILTKTNQSLSPITKHYALNKTLHDSFYKLVTLKRYKYALPIGLQCCLVALFDIPTHGYYHSPKYYHLKLQNAKQAVSVTETLVKHVVPTLQKETLLLHRKHTTGSAGSRHDNNTSKWSDYQHEVNVTHELQDLKEKEEEVKLLQQIAIENLKLVQCKTDHLITNKNIANTHTGTTASKKEVICVDDDEDQVSTLFRALGSCCGGIINDFNNILNNNDYDHDANNNSIKKSLSSSSDNQAVGQNLVPLKQQYEEKFKAQDFLNGDLNNSTRIESNNSNVNITSIDSFLETTYKSSSNDDGSKNKVTATTTPQKDTTTFRTKQQLQNNYRHRGSNEKSTDKLPTTIEISKQHTEYLPTSTENNAIISMIPHNNSPTVAIIPDTLNNKDIVNSNHNYFIKKDNEQYEADLERALYLSGLEFQSSSKNVGTNVKSNEITTNNENKSTFTTTDVTNRSKIEVDLSNNSHNQNKGQHPNLKKHESNHVNIQTISKIYQEDFNEMANNHLITIHHINTYQGRIPSSTNGCTVIAPLIVLHFVCDEKELFTRNDIFKLGKSSIGTNDSRLIYDSNNINTSINPAEDDKIEYLSKQKQEDQHINDETIQAVIDYQAPIVLKQVRAILGLQKDALIIPSDVHEYLIDHMMLHQSQFVDVCGGNILDDNQLGSFIETLAGKQEEEEEEGSNKSIGNNYDELNGTSNKKLAATFFFHEHVISILRVSKSTYASVRDICGAHSTKESKKRGKRGIFHRFGGGRGGGGGGTTWNRSSRRAQRQQQHQQPEYDDYNDTIIRSEEVWFELIDSLPSNAMFNNSSNKNAPRNSIESRFDDDNDIMSSSYYCAETTARIRCYSMRSLHAALRWYACSKFSADDQKFINTYQWDPMNVDFDPRVFQAFIWSD